MIPADIEIDEIVIEPETHLLAFNWREFWAYRELLYFLVWRDIKIKYKQSLLGISWAVFQPLIAMLIYTLVFGKMASMPSGGIPYSLFVLGGVILWNYFSDSVIASTQSLIGKQNLISKVYFPRLIIPLAAVCRGLLDFFIAGILLGILMIFYNFPFRPQIIAAPVFILFTFLLASGCGVWTSSISVKYRDLPYTVPFLVQIMFWLSPVAYGAEIIPEQYRFLYALNPMYGIIEGFRWSVLSTPAPSLGTMLLSLITTLGILVTGILYFRRRERQFADII